MIDISHSLIIISIVIRFRIFTGIGYTYSLFVRDILVFESSKKLATVFSVGLLTFHIKCLNSILHNCVLNY